MLPKEKTKCRGIIITHGHEDHIGALPYLLPQLDNVPVYSSKLTIGLIRIKLKERKTHEGVNLKILPQARKSHWVNSE